MSAEWKNSVLELMDETFNGVKDGSSGTWFVEKKEALLPLLASVDAETAFKHPWPGVASVAAHVHHTTYYMQLAVNNFQKIEVKPDWEGSWVVSEGNEVEWENIRTNLADTYAELKEILTRHGEFADNERTYFVANLAHAAFHLGSIRQLLYVLA